MKIYWRRQLLTALILHIKPIVVTGTWRILSLMSSESMLIKIFALSCSCESVMFIVKHLVLIFEVYLRVLWLHNPVILKFTIIIGGTTSRTIMVIDNCPSVTISYINILCTIFDFVVVKWHARELDYFSHLCASEQQT